MLLRLYQVLLYLIQPLIWLRLLLRSRKAPAYRKRWAERYGFCAGKVVPGGIMLHSVSVGETLAAIPLVRALRHRYPALPITVTTMTPTGSERVQSAFGKDVHHVYLPYDLPGSMNRFLDQVNPKLVIIMETELWPNLINALHQRQIPLVIANARLSARSAAGYKKIGGFMRDMLRRITLIAAQNQEDGDRFIELGLKRSQLAVTGSLKFDISVTPELAARAVTLRRQWAPRRPERYDLVVNLADQWRSAIITRLTGARIRLGFDFPKRRGFLWRHCHTQLVPVDNHAHLHTVEQNLSLLAPLNLPALSEHVTMSYDPQDWQTCEQRLQKQGVAGSYIVVQPTSRWFFKCWSEEKMAATLTALQADGHQLVITSGPDAREQAMVERILALCPPQGVISLAGQLTLRQLAALIDHAKLFIGVDSVPMHMAAALQTPCVALFGPSKLTFWRPWQATGAVIWAGDFGELPDPDAIDTGTDERYLDLIPTDAVIAAARSTLA